MYNTELIFILNYLNLYLIVNGHYSLQVCNIFFYIQVTRNEGNLLPLLMALSGIVCLPLNFISIILLVQTRQRKRNHAVNNLLFLLLIMKTIIVKVLSGIAVGALIHSYGIHARAYDGIFDAMKSYRNNSYMKYRIDKLQIEFQCCGSKTYEEWFTVQWFDPKLRAL